MPTKSKTQNQKSKIDVLHRAAALGFHACGIAAVEPMDAAPFRQWLAAGYAAEMSYLHRHAPLRENLEQLLPGARSVICVALSYNDLPASDNGIAKYARGLDYHQVLGEMLQNLWEDIRARYPGEARIFVDAGPLPERELARRAGLGWIGKNGCLIHPELGSRIVLGEILTTIPLEPTASIAGDCGSCRKCLDNCPTGALIAPGIVDARRCLSYLTIEHRGPIPTEFREAMANRLFGCDTCQDACPHSGSTDPGTAAILAAPESANLNSQSQKRNPLTAPTATDISPEEALTLTEESFRQRFLNSPILRTKRRGLARNACVVLGNSGSPAHIPALRHALQDEDPIVSEHAAWALEKLEE